MRRPTPSLGTAFRRLTAGFTLIELMVAITGGLFVSIAVFVLAKHSSRFYQSEARMGNATLSSIVGFERLRADIGRAGYLSTPNIIRDPRVCGDPQTGALWPSYLVHLQSVWIEPEPNLLPAVFADNGLAPDRITLSGAYTSADQFQAAAIYQGGGGTVVTLREKSAPMARIGYMTGTPTQVEREAILERVFRIGAALRIVDETGGEQYGQIIDIIAAAEPQIILDLQGPPIQFRGGAMNCGVHAHCTGCLVNVVNIVRYDLRSLAGHATFGRLYSTTGPTYDGDRTELVRSELDVDENVITVPNTEEVVAEFGVDLRFGIVVSDNGPDLPTTTYNSGDASVYTWGGNVRTQGVNIGAELIRAVRTTLSVRSRQADRIAGIPTLTDGGGTLAPGLYRIGLGSGGGKPFARVRTVQADIALRNQLGVQW